MLEILAAIPLILGGHELGHFKAGREAGLSMRMQNGLVHSPAIIEENPTKFAKMFGGGFEGQDLAVGMMGDTKEARLVSGINKIGYSLFPNGINDSGGDVENMRGVKGKKARSVMQGALLLSGISDLLKSQGKGLGKNSDLKFFTSDEGTPGLMFSKRF
jgi:hypothetical protein